MNMGTRRRALEDEIVRRYNAVPFTAKAAAWVGSASFEDYLFSFFDLRKYYEQSGDTTVGLETVRVYMDGVRALQAVMDDRKLKLDRREMAGRLLYELNYQMEAVMAEVERNRQNAPDVPPPDPDQARLN